MNKQQYIEFFKECQRKALAITLAKNSDYTGDSDDPFFNFKLAEHLGVVSSEKGVFVRLLDKAARVATFLKDGVLQVADEKVEDTLIDMGNYCIIEAAIIRSKRLAAEGLRENKITPAKASELVNCIDEKWGTIDVCRPGRTYQVVDYDGQVIGQYAERADAEMTAMHYKGTVREV